MATVAGMLRKLESFNLMGEVVTILTDNKEFIAEENRQQWRAGKRSDGNRIGRYRNGQYAILKNEMNPVAGLGNVDLILTGETVKSLTTDITQSSMVFKIEDDSHGVMRYGESILGITKESKGKLISERLLPKLLSVFRIKTGTK